MLGEIPCPALTSEYPGAAGVEEMSDVIGLLVLLLVIWLVCIVLGIAVKGLVWLVVLGAILFVATAVVGFVKREALGGRRR